MKVIGTLLLSLSLGLLAACPAWAMCGKHNSPQVSYDEADVVALVELVGETRDNGTFGEFDVLHAWKAELPKRINIMEPLLVRGKDLRGISIKCGYYFKHDGRYILYLHREKDGTFSTDSEPWNVHESARKAFDNRIRELEKAVECGCKGYENGGFDKQYLYERADIIVSAVVERVRKRGTLTYADLSVSSIGLNLHSSRMIIITEKENPDCGYPVSVEPDNTSNIRFAENPNHYIFYLHYDENPTGKDQETRYFTDICSGNLNSSEITQGIWIRWK